MNLRPMRALTTTNIAKYERPDIRDCHISLILMHLDQRMKEMKQLTKESHAAAKARTGDSQNIDDSGVKSINISLSSSTSAAGKKKPVFKSTLQPHNAAALGQTEPKPSILLDENQDASGAISNGWYEDRYRPQFVTGCNDTTCKFCRAKNGTIDLASIKRDVAMAD